MKKITQIISIITIITLGSCEKVIDIDLDNASKKYVVEGEVSSNPSVASTVKISQTKNFSDDNSFNGVSTAVVTIQEDNGTIYNLQENTQGIYTTQV